VNEHKLSILRRENSGNFRNKEKEYLKERIKELESKNKYKNIRDLYRGINKCKKCFQPSAYFVKDERGDQHADPHKILNRWKNYFCQLLNVHRNGDVRQTEMLTAEPFVPDPSASDVDFLFGIWKGIYLQVLIKFLQYRLREEGKYCVRRFIILLG
jgi:hypothetical protein